MCPYFDQHHGFENNKLTIYIQKLNKVVVWGIFLRSTFITYFFIFKTTSSCKRCVLMYQVRLAQVEAKKLKALILSDIS
jgi:hypothetical protein